MRRISPQQLLFAVAVLLTLSPSGFAQQTPEGCVQWKTYTDTIWVEQDVTENRLVSETTYETKEVTKSRPRWISENRQRQVTEEKPVQQTSERVVTRTVRKPVTTTKTRIKKRVEESFEDVTEMREESYTVRKPVTKTVIEKQEVLVRKPVTRRTTETEQVTVYRPQETTQTTMVPGTLLVPGQTGSSRPRMKWLQRGYYSDPYTAQPVWRRTGLHWVDEPRYGQAAVPVVVPQQRSSVTLVPETIEKEKPVEVTTYVDQYETREVPVEVQQMVEETRTRKVPYTVRIPKRKIIEEEVPYTETTYVEETVTERIPVTETVMKKVTRSEPYTELKQKWEDYTETVRIPKTKTRRVPYVSKYRVPYLVEVRVPCDASGRPVARGQQVAGTHRLHPAWRKMIAKVDGAKETTGEISVTSVFEKADAAAVAKFDVPDSAEAAAPQPGTAKPGTATAKLGPAPTNLRFGKSEPVARQETAYRLKPLQTKKVEPVSDEPQETKASRELERRIEERFRKLGIVPENEGSVKEKVETAETSARVEDSSIKRAPPEPARADFKPEAISLDLELPPEATPPETKSEVPDAESSDDDTIELDVDLKRPGRS